MALDICEINIWYIIIIHSWWDSWSLKSVEPAIYLISLDDLIDYKTFLISNCSFGCNGEWNVTTAKIDIGGSFDDDFSPSCSCRCINRP